MAENSKTISWLARSDTDNMDLLIERFVNILNTKSIKDFNKACKESKNKIFFKIYFT